MIKKLTIIIPVYNEDKTIKAVMKKINSLQLIGDLDKEIVVVNDASTDNSLTEIKSYMQEFPDQPFSLIEVEVNKGKGAAIQSGLNNATGEYLIIQDADLELDPEEINNLLEPALRNEADVVYGSRFLNNKNASSESGLHNMANRFLTGLSNLAFRTKITDMETCYKLMPTKAIQNVRLIENRFGFEPEITAKLAKIKGVRFKEVAISYEARTSEEGKKIGWTDGFRAIWCIIKYGWFSGTKKSFKDISKTNISDLKS